jgi:hypothetical protein
MTSPSVDYRLIPLTQGQFAKVDVDDFMFLNQWKWFSQHDPKTEKYYAVRNINRRGGVSTRILMHRLVLKLDSRDKRLGDHWNGNSLDNRKGNLRIVDDAQNSFNRRVNRNHSVGLKGVSAHGGKWRARITVGGNIVRLGLFSTPELAHQAYIDAANENFREYARGQ